MKYIHQCLLMYVDMDFNLVQVLMFVVYQYMYIKLIVFAIISCLHCFVHRIDLSLMLTLIILIIQTGCFSNIMKSLLAAFTQKKIQEMQRNKEINCSGTKNCLRCMYRVDHFFPKPVLTSYRPFEHESLLGNIGKLKLFVYSQMPEKYNSMLFYHEKQTETLLYLQQTLTKGILRSRPNEDTFPKRKG